jgi:large subunit ribosomal protein L5
MSFAKDYKEKIAPILKKKLGVTNIMAIPVVEKIVINVGIGSWLQGGKDFSKIVEGIEAISGQKSIVRRSRLSVSNFKLRKGMPVGVTLTLRGGKMYDFLERMIKIVAPRIRDFNGFALTSFDGRGNYSLGLKTYSVFPEIHYKDVVKNYGLAITFVTSSVNDESSKELLSSFGFPFKKQYFYFYAWLKNL